MDASKHDNLTKGWYLSCHYPVRILMKLLKSLVIILSSLWTRCSIKNIYMRTFALTRLPSPPVGIVSHFDEPVLPH